jgi:glycosyltransferase involved in cell wall biosynthesis
MASAKPIVTTRLGNIEKIIEHKKTGLLVNPGNIDELSKAIIILLSDKELRTKLGQEARKVVVRNYSWESHAKKILSLCKDIENLR